MESVWIMICIWGVLLAGSLLQGSVGFGVGLLSVGILNLFLSVKDTTLIILALTVFMSSWVVYRLWTFIRWKIIARLMIGTSVGRLFAFWFLHHFGEMMVAKKWLGLMLILLVALIYINKKYEHVIRHHMAESTIITLLVGIFGGFIGGAFAVAGPIYVLYFLIACKEKKDYHASMQMLSIVANLFTLIIHGWSGDMGQTFWFYTLTGIIPVLVGVILGYRFFSYLSAKSLHLLAYGIILLSALSMLWVH